MRGSTLSASGTELLREHADDTVIIGVWRSVMIARWKLVPTAATMREVRRVVRGTVGRAGSEFCAINLVEAHNAKDLAEDVRAEVTLTQREFASQQRGLATVIEGSGFWAATVRSVASGLALVARTPYPQKIFDRCDTAADWTAALLRDVGPHRAQELRAALADIRGWT